MNSLPMRSVILAAAILAAAPASAAGRPALAFLDGVRARELLTAPDDFLRSLSPFDRSVRLKTQRPVSDAEFLTHVAGSVRDWTEPEKRRVKEVFDGLPPALWSLQTPLPETILFIKTTGDEEGRAPYTRRNAIVFAQGFVDTVERRRSLLVHELFHILLRAHPGLRERLYASIGFLSCPAPALPAGLADRRITNPDGPRNDHCIRVTVDGEPVWAVPVIYSRSAAYEAASGGELRDYLQVGLLLAGRDGPQGGPGPLRRGEEPRVVDMVKRPAGYLAQVGSNTTYDFHPEEILAENFAQIVLGQTDVPSPEVHQRMARLLSLPSAHSR